MQIYATLLYIEFIKDTVIADSKLKFGAALQSLMRETVQPRAHLIHLSFNRVADRHGE